MNVEYKAKYLRVLLDKVQDDLYPSTTHMAMIEQALPAEWIPHYLDLLLEKVADDPHPSLDMLRRINRLADAAPSPKR
jgi:hypothetical protein